MLSVAMEVFPDMTNVLIECCQKAGEITWRQGLLLKGNGLCHGITGNGYMLHCLYRTFRRLSQITLKDDTEDREETKRLAQIAEKFRLRAFSFALASTDRKIQRQCQEYEDPQRLNKGICDHPFSLMEGLAGDICFLSDLLRDENDVRFPGYEV